MPLGLLLSLEHWKQSWLDFATEDLNSSKLERRTLEKFPRFQHRPSVIYWPQKFGPSPK